MIRLLQPEIEVEPGRRAQQVTVLEGAVGPGAALLRVTNDTSQENAFVVRLRCEDNPYWQDEWYSLRGLPSTTAPREGGVEDLSRAAVVASGKADQYGPNHRWIKLYISAGQTRDVQIAFFVPQDPNGRAGRYPFTVSVEQFVSGLESNSSVSATPAARRSRFTEVTGVAVVRPFYNWELDLLPEDGRSVGLLRRRAPWEVVVTNRGNDWLYCDLKFPRNRDILMEAPTVRLAIPPPEPGEEQFQRSVPLSSVSKLRQWRGDPIAQQLPIAATRVDAPSVAPAPEDRFPSAGGAYALGLGNVIALETPETAQAPSDRTLTYRPPFAFFRPGGVGGFLQSGRNLVFAGLGVITLLHVWALGYEHWYMQTRAEPTTVSLDRGQKLVIAGRALNGTRILIKKDVPGAEEEVLDSHMGRTGEYNKTTNIANQAANRILMPLQPMQRQYVEATVPYDRYQGSKITVYVQRLGFLPWLKAWMPRIKCSTPVQVGRPQAVARTSAASTQSQTLVGAFLPIRDATRQLGSQPGTVTIGGENATVKSWSDGEVQVVVPQTALGASEVVVTTADNGVIRLENRVEIVAPATPASSGAGIVTTIPSPIASVRPLPTPTTPQTLPNRGGGTGGIATGVVVGGGGTATGGRFGGTSPTSLPTPRIVATPVAYIDYGDEIGLITRKVQPGQVLRVAAKDVGNDGWVFLDKKYKIPWRPGAPGTIAVTLPPDVKPDKYKVRLETDGGRKLDVKNGELEVVAATGVTPRITTPTRPIFGNGVRPTLPTLPTRPITSGIPGRLIGGTGGGKGTKVSINTTNTPRPAFTPVPSRPTASRAVLRQVGPYQLALLGETSAVLKQTAGQNNAASLSLQSLVRVYNQQSSTSFTAQQGRDLTASLQAWRRADQLLNGAHSGRPAALAQLAQARYQQAASTYNGELRNPETVRELLNGSLTADESLTPAHTSLARLLDKMDYHADSRDELERAEELIMNRADANTAAEAIDVAKTALDLGERDIAKAALKRALQLNPNLERYTLVRSLRTRLGR